MGEIVALEELFVNESMSHRFCFRLQREVAMAAAQAPGVPVAANPQLVVAHGAPGDPSAGYASTDMVSPSLRPVGSRTLY